MIMNDDCFCFNAVQNNTTLKQSNIDNVHALSFNAVQNNTTLKPQIVFPENVNEF